MCVLMNHPTELYIMVELVGDGSAINWATPSRFHILSTSYVSKSSVETFRQHYDPLTSLNEGVNLFPEPGVSGGWPMLHLVKAVDTYNNSN